MYLYTSMQPRASCIYRGIENRKELSVITTKLRLIVQNHCVDSRLDRMNLPELERI